MLLRWVSIAPLESIQSPKSNIKYIMMLLQTTLDKISRDTSPFSCQSSRAYVIPPLPINDVDCYVLGLLVAAKFSKCNIYFNIDYGRGETNDEVVFLDVHFDIEEH